MLLRSGAGPIESLLPPATTDRVSFQVPTCYDDFRGPFWQTLVEVTRVVPPRKTDILTTVSGPDHVPKCRYPSGGVYAWVGLVVDLPSSAKHSPWRVLHMNCVCRTSVGARAVRRRRVGDLLSCSAARRACLGPLDNKALCIRIPRDEPS